MATSEMNKAKIILDLCGGTGSWAKPYKDAGYKVHTITLPDYDINAVSFVDDYIHFYGKETLTINRKEVYGILAAPPCTMFSFARTNAKKPRDLEEGMQCVKSCLNVIWFCMEVTQDTVKKTLPLKFWALENPYFGFLKMFLGKPAFIFDPWEFGDGYQKRTALWGNFNEPIKNPIPPSIWAKKDLQKFDMLASKDIHLEAFGSFDRQTRRSITPAKFAQAFFEANK